MTNFLPGFGPLHHDHPVLSLPTISRMDGTLFFHVQENSRIGIATTIERLIDLLDACDADCDLEDTGDDEPALGFQEDYRSERSLLGLQFGTVDCELDTADDELTLGAPERHPTPWGSYSLRTDRSGDQTRWADGSNTVARSECEDENEHGGDILDEPHDQQNEDDEDGGDREADPAESGIADADGLWQMGFGREWSGVRL